jgi:hypothetical protein
MLYNIFEIIIIIKKFIFLEIKPLVYYNRLLFLTNFNNILLWISKKIYILRINIILL